MTIEHMRRHYSHGNLEEKDLLEDPIALFTKWFEDASAPPAAEWFEANAMTLSTADEQGRVSSRIVLLKGYSDEGFRFFTNYQSDKAQQLEQNPHASLLFYWPHVERQIRIDGKAEKTSTEISDQYFHARPRGSQLGAIASQQSRPLPDRQALDQAVERLTAEHADDVPIQRPAYWGGYQVVPDRIEFWQGRPNRLHDRFAYTRSPQNTWTITRLAP